MKVFPSVLSLSLATLLGLPVLVQAQEQDIESLTRSSTSDLPPDVDSLEIEGISKQDDFPPVEPGSSDFSMLEDSLFSPGTILAELEITSIEVEDIPSDLSIDEESLQELLEEEYERIDRQLERLREEELRRNIQESQIDLQQEALERQQQEAALRRPITDLIAQRNRLTRQGDTLNEGGRFEEAEATFREALRLHPNDAVVRALRELGELRPLALAHENPVEFPEDPFSTGIPISTLLQVLGNVQVHQQQFDEAAQRALHLGHYDAVAYNGLGAALNGQGRFEEAEAAFRKVLRLLHRETIEYTGTQNATDALNGLGNTLSEQNRFEEAEAAYWEAIRLDSEDDVAYIGIGTALNEQGKYEEAEAAFREALRLNPYSVIASNRLESVLRNQAQAEEAETASSGAFRLEFDHAEFLGIESSAADHSSSSSSVANNTALQSASQLTQQAFELYQQGRYSEAEPLILRTLEIRWEQLGEDNLDVAFSLNNLALLYRYQGRYDEAEPRYEEALAILSKHLGENHPDVAISLSNLAELYTSQGRYGEAETLYVQALEIRREQLGERHFHVATSLHSLAGLHHVRGRYAEAKPLYRLALGIRREQLGERHLSIAFSLNGLAELYQDQGQYGEAEPLLSQALEIFREQLGERHPFVANSFNNLAELHQAMGNTAQTIANLQTGLDIEERNLNLNLPTLADTQRQAYISQLANNTNRAISFHLQAVPNSVEASQLALTTLLRRKGRILDEGTSSLQILRQNLTSEDQATLAQFVEMRRELATLIFNPPENLTSEQYQMRLAQLEAGATQLETTLAQRSAVFRTESEPIEIATIQTQIPANGVLIEYVRYRPFDVKNVATRLGAPRYAAYLLFPSGRIEAVDLGEAAEIDTAVQDFNRLLQNPLANLQGSPSPEAQSEGVEAISSKINALIFAPLIPYLTDQEHLLISPDSQLNRISFEALQTENGGGYLVQQYQISYLNSGRDLLKFNLADPSSAPTLILANPDYNTADSSIHLAQTPLNLQEDTRSIGNNLRSIELGQLQFGPLAGTAGEAEALALLLPNATILTDEQATENVLKTMEAPRILHIATHGFFLTDVTPSQSSSQDLGIIPGEGALASSVSVGAAAENPLLRSGLALAGFNARNSGREDGVLTALEASYLNLSGTQLVVLSACETGLGDIANGEGVYGLRRSFAIAGAETQLMSLWLVNDDSTQALMTRYYEKLIDGMGRSEALREVQLEMIAEGGRYSRPYYWAPFILAGDWRPLE